MYLRFERIGKRHRATTKKRRAASDHWRGRVVHLDMKRHVMNIRQPVQPEEIQPFLAEAERVLGEMGAFQPQIRIELDSAERFLKAHLPKPPKVGEPTPMQEPQFLNVRALARAAVERHEARRRRRRR